MTTAIKFNRNGPERLDITADDEDRTLLCTFYMGAGLIDAVLLMQEEARKHRAAGHYPPLESGTVLLSPKQMHDLKACTDAAKSRGNADANDYLHGMANGLILALAIVEGKEPEYVMSRPTPASGYDAKVGETETTAYIGGFTPIKTQADLKPLQPEPTRDYRHVDDIAVDALATKMRDKLAHKRQLGWGGWDNREICSAEYLSKLLFDHVLKGDPVDVANLCAFLSHRGDRIAAPAEHYQLLVDVFQIASRLAGTLNHTAERQEALDELRKLVHAK